MTYRFIPSMQHIACVKIALPLYYDQELQDIFEEKQMTMQQHSFDHDNHEWWQSIETRAAEKLPFLPQMFRVLVSKFIRPIFLEIKKWTLDHEDLGNLSDLYGFINFKRVLFWKNDGTINRTLTATKFVRNESFDLLTRYEMACTYFFVDDIVILWQQRDEDVKMTVSYLSSYGSNAAVRFWVRYLREEPRGDITWKEMVAEYFRHFNYRRSDSRLRVSCFFPYLSRARKRRFLSHLRWGLSHSDDFQSCLQAVEKSERMELIKVYPDRYLFCCLEWPFRSLFLEEAVKLWVHMDAVTYRGVLTRILRFCILQGFEDFDYLSLFNEFWKESPDSLKEDIRNQDEIFNAVQVVLNYNENNASLSLQEILQEQIPLYWNDLILEYWNERVW